MTVWLPVPKDAVNTGFTKVNPASAPTLNCDWVVALPVWLVVALLIRLDSRGSVFYTQERVGRDEKLFRIVKFRSMDNNAEMESGPVWANKSDPRATRALQIPK